MGASPVNDSANTGAVAMRLPRWIDWRTWSPEEIERQQRLQDAQLSFNGCMITATIVLLTLGGVLSSENVLVQITIGVAGCAGVVGFNWFVTSMKKFMRTRADYQKTYVECMRNPKQGPGP
jgi:hypothetical protein